SQHDGAMTIVGGFTGTERATPWQALLDGIDLRERFLSDGQRLDQNRNLPQLTRHRVHVGLLVHHEAGHESVQLLDTTLAEIARVAEILAAGAARDASLMRAWAANHGHHQVARM